MQVDIELICEQQANLAENQPEAWITWGDVLYIKGKVEKAKEKYLKAFDLNNKDTQALLRLGDLYNHCGDSVKAIEYYGLSQISEAEPSEIYYKWGKLLHSLKNYKSALHKFEASIQSNPENSKVYYAWGNTLACLEKFQEAAEKYNLAIQKDPSFSLAHNNLGIVLAELGLFPEAVEHFYDAITIDPDLTLVYDNWDQVLKSQAGNKSLDANSKFSHAYHNWANYLAGQGKSTEAIEKYERAAEICPEFELVYFSWGSALEKLGKFEEAQFLYRNKAPISTQSEMQKQLALKVQLAIQIHTETPNFVGAEGLLQQDSMKNKVQQVQQYQQELNEKVVEKLEETGPPASPGGTVDGGDPATVKEEREKIYSRRELVEYYEFFQREFNTIIATAFIVNGGRFKEKDDAILSFLSWAADYIPTVGSFVSFIIDKVNDHQIDTANKKYIRCISLFVDMVEPSLVIEYIARKLAIKRQDVLIAEYKLPFMDGSLVKNKTAKKFLHKDNISSKAHERAFIDLSKLLVECFLKEMPYTYSSPSEKLAVIGKFALERMDEVIANEGKENEKKKKKK